MRISNFVQRFASQIVLAGLVAASYFAYEGARGIWRHNGAWVLVVLSILVVAAVVTAWQGMVESIRRSEENHRALVSKKEDQCRETLRSQEAYFAQRARDIEEETRRKLYQELQVREQEAVAQVQEAARARREAETMAARLADSLKGGVG